MLLISRSIIVFIHGFRLRCLLCTWPHGTPSTRVRIERLDVVVNVRLAFNLPDISWRTLAGTPTPGVLRSPEPGVRLSRLKYSRGTSSLYKNMLWPTSNASSWILLHETIWQHVCPPQNGNVYLFIVESWWNCFVYVRTVVLWTVKWFKHSKQTQSRVYMVKSIKHEFFLNFSIAIRIY